MSRGGINRDYSLCMLCLKTKHTDPIVEDFSQIASIIQIQWTRKLGSINTQYKNTYQKLRPQINLDLCLSGISSKMGTTPITDRDNHAI